MSSSSRTFSYVFDRNAALKILLHALKYPTTGVCGYLLGEDRETQEKGTAGDSFATVVHITDAVPVLHNFLTLTPSLEIALTQIQAYCQETKRTGNEKHARIVGYYQCNERMQDVDLGTVGKRVADRVEALFPGAIAICLNASALKGSIERNESSIDASFCPYVKDSRKGWSDLAPNAFTCSLAGVVNVLTEYVSEGRHHKLMDFEDYLEDVTADWMNTDITN